MLCNSSNSGHLPKRVVEVGTDEETIKLYETQNEDSPYVALSHCWGKNQHILTKSDSIDRWKRGIPWQCLPATFRDSVMITRRLGLQYLWIDSLCIIQDSVVDWEVESSKMGAIYQNAALVISATRSAGSDQGCFSRRSRTLTFSGVSSSGSPFEVFARQSPDHSAFDWGQSHWFTSRNIRYNQEVPSHPLFSRAWCFQERILGQRIVHYCESEIIWECLTCLQCECNALDGFKEDRLRDVRQFAAETSRKPERSAEDWLVLWRDLVAAYSMSRLTFAKDRLPALSGLASTWASNIPGRYLAGLWESDLERNLLWKSVPHGSSRLSNEGNGEVGVTTAPSWSWAKTQRGVDWIAGIPSMHGNPCENPLCVLSFEGRKSIW